MQFDLKMLVTLLYLTSCNLFAAQGDKQTYDEYPFYFKNIVSVSDSADSESIENQVQILHSGIASLQKRIDLIRKAKKRISIEYFIWEKDTTGLLLFHELIKRAKEGIDIRIILDKSITIIEMDEFYAQALAKYGIDLRHYHRALDPMSAQFRTHRKILVIDGEEGITGGRNIGDDYFDLDEVYNFLDRDIYIQGPVAKAMQDSFDAYWKDPIVKESKVLTTNPSSNRLFRDRRNRDRYQDQRQKALDRQRAEAKEWIEGHATTQQVVEKVEQIARPILNGYPVEVCPKLTFVSDRPGANFLEQIKRDYKKDYRILRKVMFDHIRNETKESDEFIMASPYFMLNDDWQDALSYVIRDKNVTPTVYTNSLGSTDAFYVAANFYDKIYDWEEVGLLPYIHESSYDPYYPVYNEKVATGRWGMHEKTQLYNDESFFVGTYNIDNRSDFYNAEMGIFCEGSKTLTENLREDMKQRIGQSYLINGKESAVDSEGKDADIYGHASESQILIMKSFTIPARLFKPLM